MIDSHSHIYSAEFDADRDQVVRRAREAGVTHVILPNENLASLERLAAMHERWPGYVSMTIGLHPEEIGPDYEHELEAMHSKLLAAAACRYVAVGEIGIDLYWDASRRDEQMQALDTQLHWCKEAGIPFIMHCRKGLDECLAVLDNFGEPLPRGVFHSFTGTVAQVEAVRRRGDFYFGVNGIVTFKKSDVPALLPVIGLERILLETDSPYLAPVPKRGTRNESCNIPLVAACVARHLGVSVDEVERATDAGARDLFFNRREVPHYAGGQDD